MNLAVMWFSLACFTLLQQGAALTNLYVLLRTASLKLIAVRLQVLRDVETLKVVRSQVQTLRPILTLANLILPVAAVIIFGALLIQANPLIESLISQITWGNPQHFFASWGPFVAIAAFALIWSVLRMRFKPEDNTTWARTKILAEHLLAHSTVAITLLILNAMFLFENLFDYKYVWLKQSLPPGMNYADYVHRGAYTLIVTAILAGALVTFILQPGAVTENSKTLRWLVFAWIIQNLALVFSSALRTLAYVDAYGMTQWRLAGLIWMGVVAAGLMWIVLRIILKRGHLWLVNANLASTFALLLVCGFINFGSIVAEWNVARRLNVMDVNPDIDIAYLLELGPAALPAIQKLQNNIASYPNLSLHFTIQKAALDKQQANWQSWTLRGAWLQSLLSPEPIYNLQSF